MRSNETWKHTQFQRILEGNRFRSFSFLSRLGPEDFNPRTNQPYQVGKRYELISILQ